LKKDTNLKCVSSSFVTQNVTTVLVTALQESPGRLSQSGFFQQDAPLHNGYPD